MTKTDNIISDIEYKIEKGQLKQGEQLPSLNIVMQEFSVSRDTTIKAYKDLLSRGIVYSLPGKGYYVSDNRVGLKKNILLLFDELSAYKSVLVRSIEKELEKHNGQYTILFHHYNATLFRQLIEINLNRFTHYAVMPFPGSREVLETLELIPSEKLVLLDRHDGIRFKSRFVGQEYAADIRESLEAVKGSMKKYNRFRFLFPQPSFHSVDLQKGFNAFCKSLAVPASVVAPITLKQVAKGEAYLVIDDEDLVRVIQLAEAGKLKIGKDVGIISYNETPLKSVVAGGITTISTDFSLMGKNLVELVYNPSLDYIHNPAKLIMRKSF